MEKTELNEQASEEEVEGAQAHDGHDVRGVGQEGVTGDGEDGGDRVECKEDVGELDGEEAEEEHGGHAAAALADEELVLAEADGMDAGEPFDPARGACRLLFLLGDEEADGGGEQDEGEHIADPGEAGEQAEAGGDEGSAHDDGASDSPEEDARLAGGFDLEELKEEEEDEEVVDGESLFDGVAGEVLDGGGGAEGAEDEDGEGQGGADPEDGGDNGGAVHLVFGGGASDRSTED